MGKTDLKLHSAVEVENARTKGQVVGFAQGAGAVLLLGVLTSLLGWIPVIAVGAVVVVVAVKALSK